METEKYALGETKLFGGNMIKTIEESYGQLYERILKTRGARIKAEDRLLKNDQQYQIIQLVYTVF